MTLRNCYDETPLRAYMDEALPAEEQGEISFHLAGCLECRARLRELKLLAREVGSLVEMHTPVPDARLAFARLQMAQHTNGTAAKVGAPSAVRSAVPTLVSPSSAAKSRPNMVHGWMRFVLAGVGVALAVVLALGLSALFASKTLPLVGVPGGEFLPAGKVRHIILTSASSVEGGAKGASQQATEGHREEFWLTQGANNPLMRTEVTAPMTASTWLMDDAYYDYEPSQGNEVHRYPYDEKYLATVMPDPEIVSKTLKMSNARVAGEATLGTRPATVIEVTSDKNADPLQTITYWIDRETNQLLQTTIVLTYTGGAQNGLVERHINKIALDELKARSDYPPDYFAFIQPPGTVVVEPDLAPGTEAPDFTLPDVRTGKPVILSSLRGKPVMLLFWGSWCPPCRDALPIVQELHKELGVGVDFISISFGPRDTPDSVRRFAEAQGYDWTFVHDSSSHSIMDTYKVSTVPLFYFIDRAGVIKAIHIGGASREHLLDGFGEIGVPVNPLGVSALDAPGWYTFTSPYGAFSVLMPRAVVDVGGSGGWNNVGVKNGAVTYMASYRDYALDAAVTPEKWLDDQLASIADDMNGSIKAAKSIHLDDHIGREISIARTDGRFTRARIYLVGTRIYNIYAIAQDETTSYSEEVERYLSSFRLLTP